MLFLLLSWFWTLNRCCKVDFASGGCCRIKFFVASVNVESNNLFLGRFLQCLKLDGVIHLATRSDRLIKWLRRV